MPRAEVLETALHRFRTHRLQTWLTLAGLFVGTSSIIVVVALGLTGRGFVMTQIEGVGSRLVWANYQETVTSGVARRIDDQIRDSDALAVAERRDLFAGVTPLLVLHGQIVVLAHGANLTVLGTTANYPLVRKNLRLLRGRFLDDDDVGGQAKVCVVSRHLYEQLYGVPSAGGPDVNGGEAGGILEGAEGGEDGEGGGVSRTVRTLGMAFAVVGEFEEPVNTLGQGDVTPDTIFIPITTAWFFAPAHRIDTLFAEVRDFAQVGAGVEGVQAILRDRHRAGAQYDVQSMSTVIRVANVISVGLMAVFVLVAAVSVLVGGVGIMNILLASVEQRTREIGLRISVGARRSDILHQFLLEALLLGSIGASLGVVGGLGLPLLCQLLVRSVTVQVSFLAAVLAFLFSCGVTVLFGLVPAYRAARLNPVEALRHE